MITHTVTRTTRALFTVVNNVDVQVTPFVFDVVGDSVLEGIAQQRKVCFMGCARASEYSHGSPTAAAKYLGVVQAYTEDRHAIRTDQSGTPSVQVWEATDWRDTYRDALNDAFAWIREQEAK